VVKPAYLAVPQSKLNVVAINKPFCQFHGLGIVGAIGFKRIEEIPVGADDINAIFRHHRGVRGLGNESHSSILAAVSACWAR
jgi:hypothetical protein